MTSSGRILLVDDDQRLLDAMRRQHGRTYELTTACGPEDGLAAIAGDGPFAVVVSDFQMPGMDGVTFLTKVAERSPETVRIMLTGNPGLKVAMDAVNGGHIFRFLTKPCEPEVFRQGLEAALEQHRLRRAERDLLEQTLAGCVQVLADILSLVSPDAFGRALRVTDYARQLAAQLGLKEPWRVETAAMLSQVGCVAIPGDVVQKVALGSPLTATEQALYDAHPGTAMKLLGHVPRLEEVARMITLQRLDAVRDRDCPADVWEGGRVLAAALAFDHALSAGRPREDVIQDLARRGIEGKILTVLRELRIRQETGDVVHVEVRKLRQGMTLEQDILNEKGALLIPKGRELTIGLLERLRSLERLGTLEPTTRIAVRVTRDDPVACGPG